MKFCCYSVLPAYQETKMEWLWSERSHITLVIPKEGGGGGIWEFQMTGA